MKTKIKLNYQPLRTKWVQQISAAHDNEEHYVRSVKGVVKTVMTKNGPLRYQRHYLRMPRGINFHQIYLLLDAYCTMIKPRLSSSVIIMPLVLRMFHPGNPSSSRRDFTILVYNPTA